MGLVEQGLARRQAQIKQRLGELAYERDQLRRRIGDLDNAILQLEGAQEVVAQAARDAQAQKTIDEAAAQVKAEAAQQGGQNG